MYILSLLFKIMPVGMCKLSHLYAWHLADNVKGRRCPQSIRTLAIYKNLTRCMRPTKPLHPKMEGMGVAVRWNLPSCLCRNLRSICSGKRDELPTQLIRYANMSRWWAEGLCLDNLLYVHKNVSIWLLCGLSCNFLIWWRDGNVQLQPKWCK